MSSRDVSDVPVVRALEGRQLAAPRPGHETPLPEAAERSAGLPPGFELPPPRVPRPTLDLRPEIGAVPEIRPETAPLNAMGETEAAPVWQAATPPEAVADGAAAPVSRARIAPEVTQSPRPSPRPPGLAAPGLALAGAGATAGLGSGARVGSGGDAGTDGGWTEPATPAAAEAAHLTPEETLSMDVAQSGYASTDPIYDAAFDEAGWDDGVASDADWDEGTYDDTGWDDGPYGDTGWDEASYAADSEAGTGARSGSGGRSGGGSGTGLSAWPMVLAPAAALGLPGAGGGGRGSTGSTSGGQGVPLYVASQSHDDGAGTGAGYGAMTTYAATQNDGGAQQVVCVPPMVPATQ